MLRAAATTPLFLSTTTTTISPLLLLSSPFLTKPTKPISLTSSIKPIMSSFLNKLFSSQSPTPRSATTSSSSSATGPDTDIPSPGHQFAQFGAGCFWGVELAFQRVPGVTKTEVGYSQGGVDDPSYEDVCSGTTGHSEVIRVMYDVSVCGYERLLEVFWERHDPTTLNRQVKGGLIAELNDFR
ncbi:hypothetical protein Droror1_Dr00025577, partial [Drosera rotundifolia]